MARLRATAAIGAFAAIAALTLRALSAEAADIAVLQGLDKVTARVSPIRAPVGETVAFGALEITVLRCEKKPPEEPPDIAAFLEIRDRTPGKAPVLRFHGWMFASSRALSALDHPVYDVWVVDCRRSVDSSSDDNSP